jgi:SAM-dependent methyltransferase
MVFLSVHSPDELRRMYDARFSRNLDYRKAIWAVLVSDWFAKYVRPTDTVLDLGCGYGEFINQIACGKKYGMDLNPGVSGFLNPDVTLLPQDCSSRWPLPDASLDVVFTSNFFEHLPDKATLGGTLDEIARCLRPGGRLIAMGPNIKCLHGAYWDFWDHYVPITEASLHEALITRGFAVDVCVARFLPYTMASGPQYPLFLVRAYLALPIVWHLFGKQFLVVGRKS